MTHFASAERTRKYRVLSRGLVLGNAVLRWQLEHAVAPNAFALVETIGRRSGRSTTHLRRRRTHRRHLLGGRRPRAPG